MNAFLNSLRFHNPFAKRFCPWCGASCGANEETCRNCHSELRDDDGYYRGLRNMPDVSPVRQIALAFGYLYMQIIAVIVSYIALMVQATNYAAMGYGEDRIAAELEYWSSGADYLSIVNYVTYAILFAAVLLILWNECAKIFVSFKDARSYLGIPLGFGLIIVSVAWNMVLSALAPDLSESENQELVIKMVQNWPFFAVLITGFIGPFVEELVYRVGLFGFLRRMNVYLAYIVGSLVFGMIHMQDFASRDEWINLTSYLLSGLYLAFVYEKFGFGASFMAHAVNNLVSVLEILLLQQGS